VSFKHWINDLVGLTGYQIVRLPSIARNVALGKYRWLQERNIKTVLDIGANTGQFARMIRQILPHAMIYSFEPLASCFQELTVNASSLMPIQCFPFALGKESAILKMQRNDFTPSSSILSITKRTQDAFPHTARVVDEQITVCTLDELASDLSLVPGVLLKADVQGYELKVLLGAESTLPQIDILIIETSFAELYRNQPLFHDVYQFLHDRQFTYVGSIDQLPDPTNGMILQSDSIFVNPKNR
jgi:FkbM family methyltransferase